MSLLIWTHPVPVVAHDQVCAIFDRLKMQNEIKNLLLPRIRLPHNRAILDFILQQAKRIVEAVCDGRINMEKVRHHFG